MLPPLRFLRACAPVSLCTNNISVSLRLSGLRAEQRVNLCLFPCRHICLGVNLQVLPCLWIFCASVGLCVYPCICHSMRGHRSLCVSQSLWLESFSAYACLRVTFVYLCVFLNDSVCSHVVRSFWVCVCGFVSTCISRVFVVSVSRTVDEWKWSFSQTPFVPWPCAAWKPQAVSSRGRTWAWAALSGHLGRGAAAAGRSRAGKVQACRAGRRRAGAGLADPPGAFCPLLALLRLCTSCCRREGPGSRPTLSPASERSRVSSPVIALQTRLGPQTFCAAFRSPPPSPTPYFPVPGLFLSTLIPWLDGAPVAWPPRLLCPRAGVQSQARATDCAQGRVSRAAEKLGTSPRCSCPCQSPHHQSSHREGRREGPDPAAGFSF
ncbi:uncharacterized protein LOC118926659 isoform X1 [Manis pentadactyla]|uniref:uncharacterized protein LOC118926659 isoform X1 n=1 Tax=Manis pentadactyla TaxID=143292 RepID=UPI00255C30E7|nr:uncharacterized protein LOC118926659 isoform X1 [Manis pentadactyla]